MEIAGLYIASYLLGSLPTAYLIGKLVKGVDIRNYGSGNVGGSNVLHHFGKRWSVPLELFDILVKGALPVWIGLYVLGLERSSALLVVGALAGRSGAQLVDIPEVSRGAGHSNSGWLFTGAVSFYVGRVCRSLFDRMGAYS